MKKENIAQTIILLVLLIVLTPRKVFAQEKIPLVVAPARQQASIDPGESITLSTKFFNQSEIPLGGNIKVVDFIVRDKEGSPVFLYDTQSSASSRFAAASWVSLNQDKISILPGSIATVQYKINSPEDARPGGRYIAVFFEPIGLIGQEQTVETTSLLSITPRIASLIYLRVNGPITESALLTRLDTPKFLEYGPVNIEAEILNKGDYHITPTGQITLSNWFGKEIASYTLEEKNIFPDASRIYESKLGGRWLIGRYSVSFTALYGETNQVLTKTTHFWAFPVRIVLVIILTITLIVLLVILIYRKLKGRQSQLEEKLQEEISEIESLKNKYQDSLASKFPPERTEKKK